MISSKSGKIPIKVLIVLAVIFFVVLVLMAGVFYLNFYINSYHAEYDSLSYRAYFGTSYGVSWAFGDFEGFFTVYEMSLRSNRVDFILTNTADREMIIENISVSSEHLKGECSMVLSQIDSGPDHGNVLDAGDKIFFHLTGDGCYFVERNNEKESSVKNYLVNISYSEPSGLGGIIKGRVSTTMIPSSYILGESSFSILKRKEDESEDVDLEKHPSILGRNASLAYVTSRESGGSIQILDVSDPGKIVPLGSIRDNASLALEFPKSISVDGGLAYVGSGEGVQILDVSDPGKIVPLGSIRDNASLALDFPKSIFVSDGLVYVIDHSLIDNEVWFQILDVSDPKNIMLLGNIRDTDGLDLKILNSVFVSDGLAYLAGANEDDSIIQILNVSDPKNIRILDRIRDNHKLALINPWLPASYSLSFLQQTNSLINFWLIWSSSYVDVKLASSLYALQELINGLTLKFPADIFVSDGLAYVTSRDESGLQILDVSDPGKIVPLGNIKNSSLLYANSVFVSDGLAYVTGGYKSGLQILDVSDPGKIVPLGSIKIDTFLGFLYGADSVFVSDGLAYVTGGYKSGLQILDVSDPGKIVPLGNIRDNASLALNESIAVSVVI